MLSDKKDLKTIFSATLEIFVACLIFSNVSLTPELNIQSTDAYFTKVLADAYRNKVKILSLTPSSNTIPAEC